MALLGVMATRYIGVGSQAMVVVQKKALCPGRKELVGSTIVIP